MEKGLTTEQIEELIRESTKPKRGRPKKGEGFKSISLNRNKVRRMPQKLSETEKMKNRTRLVVSQIQAGNTNPKLITEINRLYKKLYKIDNAYSLLKK